MKPELTIPIQKTDKDIENKMNEFKKLDNEIKSEDDMNALVNKAKQMRFKEDTNGNGGKNDMPDMSDTSSLFKD